ncbi:MAG: BatD family protein [Bacteroidales bacterium]
MSRLLLIISLILFFNLNLYAEEINFEASAPSQVRVGERFRLTFSVDAKPSEFTAPRLNDFRIISGPNQSSSSSVQIINGQVSKSNTYTYTYILEALNEGSFKIDGAVINHNNKQYKSNTLQINVVKGTSKASPGRNREQTNDNAAISDEDIFIKAFVSKTSPYQGEQLVLYYKIYTRLNIAQYSFSEIPALKSFWSEEVNMGSNQQAKTENFNGKRYRVAEIRRTIIFPQKSGEITIDPLEIECIVQIPTQQRRRGNLIDEFFGGSFFDQYQNEKILIKSNPVKLNVKPLPAQNRPAAFNGLVGQFDISAKLSKQDLKQNDAANFEITINGNGNIRMIDEPNINFPVNLDTFDPNIKDNINISNNGVSGKKSFDYLLIPRTGGEFTIPSVKFSYFDPDKGSYVNKSTESFTINAASPDFSGTDSESASQEEIKLLSEEIRFIHTKSINLNKKDELFIKSRLFYILLITPALLFALLIIYRRRQIQLHSNKALLKNRKAQKLARKKLKNAEKYLNDGKRNEFYDEISKALWGYISDKLDLPPSLLNRDNIKKEFEVNAINEDLANQFLSAIDDCEYARFAPGDHKEIMDDIYNKAESIIINTEKELKKQKA